MYTDLDTDWYTTTPIANGSISFTIRFTHYDGDLVLDLMNGSGGLLQRSDTSTFVRGEEVILLPDSTANAKIFPCACRPSAPTIGAVPACSSTTSDLPPDCELDSWRGRR